MYLKASGDPRFLISKSKSGCDCSRDPAGSCCIPREGAQDPRVNLWQPEGRISSSAGPRAWQPGPRAHPVARDTSWLSKVHPEENLCVCEYLGRVNSLFFSHLPQNLWQAGWISAAPEVARDTSWHHFATSIQPYPL